MIFTELSSLILKIYQPDIGVGNLFFLNGVLNVVVLAENLGA